MNRREVSINDIDVKTRDAIVKILRYHHVTPTTERIVSYYLGATHGLTLSKDSKIDNRSVLVKYGRYCSTEEYEPVPIDVFVNTSVTTTRMLRKLFWQCYPETKKELYRYTKRQNDYPTDVRCTWVDFVENLRRDNLISQHLADITTL